MARHLYRCPLRWADMDIYGIVNNVVFLRYLEEARVDFIFGLGPTEGDAFFKDGSVVVRHEIDYKNRLVHRLEPVDIEMWVTGLETATVAIGYEVKDDKYLYARASTVMAPFDYVKNRPRRLTDEEIAFFEKYLETTSQ
jgi:acyl-CoA thioester hydrolase